VVARDFLFTTPIQTSSGAQPASCTRGIRSLSRDYNGHDMALNTHLHPVLSLTMSRVTSTIPSVPSSLLMGWPLSLVLLPNTVGLGSYFNLVTYTHKHCVLWWQSQDHYLLPKQEKCVDASRRIPMCSFTKIFSSVVHIKNIDPTNNTCRNEFPILQCRSPCHVCWSFPTLFKTATSTIYCVRFAVLLGM
jgi:hypothetical protein